MWHQTSREYKLLLFSPSFHLYTRRLITSAMVNGTRYGTAYIFLENHVFASNLSAVHCQRFFSWLILSACNFRCFCCCHCWQMSTFIYFIVIRLFYDVCKIIIHFGVVSVTLCVCVLFSISGNVVSFSRNQIRNAMPQQTRSSTHKNTTKMRRCNTNRFSHCLPLQSKHNRSENLHKYAQCACSENLCNCMNFAGCLVVLRRNQQLNQATKLNRNSEVDTNKDWRTYNVRTEARLVEKI